MPAAAAYTPAVVEIVILLVGNTAIAVTAYRAVIKEVPPRWRTAMRHGRREWRFLGLTLLFYTVECVAIILLVLLVLGLAHVTGATSALRLATTYYAVLLELCLVLLGNLVVSATVTPIFGLALPLAAIDAASGFLRRAAHMSRGYRARLGAISLLVTLPVVAASYAPYLAWTPADTSGFYVREAAFAVIGLLGIAFATTAFACAFRIIAAGRSEGVYKVFD